MASIPPPSVRRWRHYGAVVGASLLVWTESGGILHGRWTITAFIELCERGRVAALNGIQRTIVALFEESIVL